MKQYSWIFITVLSLCSYCVFGKDETDCQQPLPNAIDKMNNDIIQTILKASDLSVKEKQKASRKATEDDAKAFVESLPENERIALESLLKKLKTEKGPLTKIIEGPGAPVLFVNGLDALADFPFMWIRPFNKLLKKEQMSYFFNWDKFNSFEKNVDDLQLAVKNILSSHPGQNLKIVAYSAGGVVTTFAMDKIMDDEKLADRISFHTIASPLYGYQAPAFAVLGSSFAGKTAITIGQGRFDKLKHKTFPNCHHWITTSCELDMHTCDNRGVNPQLGGKSFGPLPCGETKTKKFSNESHTSILHTAILEILPE